MSSGGKYGEPWFKACGTGGEAQVLKYSLELVTTLAATNGKHEEATRIVQCVNACKGMSNPEGEVHELFVVHSSYLLLLSFLHELVGDKERKLSLQAIQAALQGMQGAAQLTYIRRNGIRPDNLSDMTEGLI